MRWVHLDCCGQFSRDLLQISLSFQKMDKARKLWYLSLWKSWLRMHLFQSVFIPQKLSYFFSFWFLRFNISFFPSFSERLCWTLKPVLYTTVSFPVCLDCLSQCVYLPMFISLRVYFTCYILKSFILTCFQWSYCRSLLDSGFTGLENQGGFLQKYLQSLRLDETTQDIKTRCPHGPKFSRFHGVFFGNFGKIMCWLEGQKSPQRMLDQSQRIYSKRIVLQQEYL